jgi:putative Mg2+ transporter-C (MgtC) family protein
MTLQYVLTIFVGAILGGAIGLEREYRSKEAGFRTHFLVGLGSALFMVLSMHGFDGFEGQPGVIIQRDPARMAAQVVSGIGFIGAGTIIFQKNVVKGLTTAAGLWVTSAIGMTAGVGMYEVAVAATVLVLICLEGSDFLHHHVFKSHKREYDVDDNKE